MWKCHHCVVNCAVERKICLSLPLSKTFSANSHNAFMSSALITSWSLLSTFYWIVNWKKAPRGTDYRNCHNPRRLGARMSCLDFKNLLARRPAPSVLPVEMSVGRRLPLLTDETTPWLPWLPPFPRLSPLLSHLQVQKLGKVFWTALLLCFILYACIQLPN